MCVFWAGVLWIYVVLSHSEDCFFADCFLCLQKVLILFSSICQFSLFFPRSCGFFSVLKCFPFSSFRVDNLTLRTFYPLELIFIQGKRLSSVFWQVDIHIPQHRFLTRMSFLQCVSLVPLQELVDCSFMGLSLGSAFCFIGMCVSFCASTVVFWLL